MFNKLKCISVLARAFWGSGRPCIIGARPCITGIRPSKISPLHCTIDRMIAHQQTVHMRKVDGHGLRTRRKDSLARSGRIARGVLPTF